MRKQLYFVVSGKASVGKSLFTRSAVEILRRQKDIRGIEVGAVDADIQNDDLRRFFGVRGGIWDGCTTIDVDKDHMEIVNTLDFFDDESDKDQIILVDFRGANFGTILTYADEINGQAQGFGVELNIINIIDHTLPSAQSVIELCSAFGKDVNHFVIKSGIVNDLGSFIYYDYNTYDSFDFTASLKENPSEHLANAGGKTLVMPKLKAEKSRLFLDTRNSGLFDPVFDNPMKQKEAKVNSSIVMDIKAFRKDFEQKIITAIFN